MPLIRLFIFATVLIFSGCAYVERVDTENDTSDEQFALDYRDFEEAAVIALNSMISSGYLGAARPERPVMAIGKFINGTTLHIDMDQLVKKIRVELTNSGRVYVSTAIGIDAPEEQLNFANRDLRNNEEFDQDSLPATGTLQAANFALSGKIIQNTIRKDRSTNQLEYYFQMTLTDLTNGFSVWEGESLIVKRGTASTVSW